VEVEVEVSSPGKPIVAAHSGACAREVC